MSDYFYSLEMLITDHNSWDGSNPYPYREPPPLKQIAEENNT
jgi:hypothetical protein